MKSLEKSEKNLKVILHEKDLVHEQEKSELKKQLFYEKSKAERMQKLASDIKEEFSRKHAVLIQESLSKDETIKKITSALVRVSAKSSRNNNNLKNPTFIEDFSNNNTCKINRETKDTKETKETEILTQRTGEKIEILGNVSNIEINEKSDSIRKHKNKSFSACNKKTKSISSNINEEVFKKEAVKLQVDQRSQSRLKIMRKGSYYEKENIGQIFSSNISKNLSQKTIQESNKTYI